MTRPFASLLCVCNYPANTGYAWDFIESLYAGMASRLAPHGIRTLVAYPRIEQPPHTLKASVAEAVELDATLTTRQSVKDTLAFVRRHKIGAIYLTDHPARSFDYARLRAAGIRHIIVHDHASGERSIPKGIRRLLKWLMARAPRIVADEIVAVSDYVAKRHIVTGMMPAGRVTRVWNGLAVPPISASAAQELHEAFTIALDRPIVVCACRAAREKGVPHLLKAFDLLAARWPADRPRPVLVYMGDGPQLTEIRAIHEQLRARGDVLVTGYRRDAGMLQAGADVCAMPSVWQDALPLAVMQPMALGRAVVGSRVGGIPEMIADGETGILVPPGDEPALADALELLLTDRQLAAKFGQAARERVARLFTPDGQLESLTSVVLRGFPSP